MENLAIAYQVLNNVEDRIRSTGSNIICGVDAELSPYYEEQFDPRRPMILYNPRQDLYYFSFGPRQTPGKRPYPTRIFGEGLDGSQPEFFYSTVQAVDFCPIIERISDTQYRVWPEAMKGWPQTVSFYMYLAQKDQGSGENISQQWDAMYRYVKVDGNDARIKITAANYDTGVITFAAPVILDIPAQGTEDWEDYQARPLVLVFFDYRIDQLLDSELQLFVGDESAETVSLKETATIIATDNLSTLYVEVIDIYEGDDFVESSMPDPSEDTDVMILLRTEGGTILSYKQVKITNALQVSEREVLLYEDIDPANPFYEVDDRFVEDPFETATSEGIGDGNPEPLPDGPLEPTGKAVFRKWRVNITPLVSTLAPGNDFAYFDTAETITSTITDEELAVPLHATQGSMRPHNFLTLAPLQAPAFADASNFNWAAPLPYPETTCVLDCDEAIVNGFLTPKEVSAKRLSYRRDRNTWSIGGTVFCICRNFADMRSVIDCIVNRNNSWYIKIADAVSNYGVSTEGNARLYHMAFTKW